jgi:large subunit ribosomal protein L3
MIEGLIGKKIGMTQTFGPEGTVIPVTVIKAGPCTVVQKKTVQSDGYEALQLGFVEEKGVRKPSKASAGHFQKAGVPPTRLLREFRFTSQSEIKEGDQVFVDIFQAGEKVHVTGTSKGKGFQGVVTRHGFRGGRATHGSMFHRAPGSIGASSYPSRVLKGTRMGGHMGQDRVTARNLVVVESDKDNNLLLVRGAVPGPRGGYVLILKGSFTAKTG